MACTSGGRTDAASVPEQFPVGLRVLVVDDDPTCLRILEQMLRRCLYEVTCCSQATAALNLLRERKDCFDIILSDVHMPDMDGLKLLELVGLEMDLPVIMMSADGRTHLVMRGIKHGACDYLIKPIRDEELKNIWQHVIRKRWNEIKETDHSDSMEDHDRQKRAVEDAEYASSVTQGADEVLKAQKKRKDSRDEGDTELENGDLTTAKKPRVVWSVELHQQFVNAVNQLGIDKAVPKRILELMNVPGLTRENVASHLQKFRLYLKRLSGVAQQQAGLLISYCGPVEQNLKLASLGRFDIQALAASGQFPPQTLAALHAELMSRPAGSLILPAMDQRTLLHESLQGSKRVPVDRNVAYGQPLIKCPPNPAKQTSQPGMSNEDPLSEFVPWAGDTMPACNLAPVIETNSNMLMTFIQQQQQQKQPAALEQGCLINVQPSCMVAPSQSSLNFHAGNRPIYMNQDCSFRNGAVDYANTSLQPNNLSGVGEVLNIESKPGNAGSGSSCSRTVQGSTCQRVPSSTPATVQVPNMNSVQGTNNSKPDMGHASARTPIYVGKKTSIPSRFAVDENELPMSNVSQVKLYSGNNGNKVKKEPTMVVSENVEVCSAEASSF